MHVEEGAYQELAGDPDHLQRMATHYMTIADAIRSSVTALDAIHDDDANTSQATDALKSSAKEVADDITKAENRYRVTAQALLDYVPSLRSAQSDAHTAVVQIQHFQGEVATTGTALTKATTAADNASDAERTDAAKAQATAQADATDAQNSLTYWQGQWDNARTARDTAAETAKSKIDDVVQHHNNGLKNPTHHWWDGPLDFLKDVATAIGDAGAWVWDHLDEISSWLGVASLLLGWVPILGDVLIVASLIVGALKLIKDVASGKSWQTILGDSVGLVLTAFGGGATKFLAKTGKFGAAEKFLAEFKGSNSARNALFKETFGVKPAQFLRYAKTGEGSAANLSKFARPSLTSFLGEVKSPVSFAKGSVTSAFRTWAKSGGGLNIAKLGTEAGFADGANVLKQLPTLNKVGLLVMDGRKVLGNVQTVVNTTNDLAHGDLALKGDRNPQITLQPDKVAIKAMS